MPLMTLEQSLTQSARFIVVSGSPGVGKTALSVSASDQAGDTVVHKEPVLCTDTLIVQGDAEGVLGAVDVGLKPGYIVDMTAHENWTAYLKDLLETFKELKPKLGTEIKYVVVDLSLVNRLIDKHVDPSVQKDWKLVAAEGIKFYQMLSTLKGVTIIGNTHLKTASSPGESAGAANSSQAKAIGGEASTLTADLYKGVFSVWKDNASLILVRESKRKKQADGSYVSEYKTLTQSTALHEAKSRARSSLPAVLPGDMSLNAILRKVYNKV